MYLFLALVGLVLPYYFFLSFVADSGLDLAAFVKQLFGTKISTFFAVDLLISSVVFLVYVRDEARRFGMCRWWPYIAATLLVGLSFAFPLFLYVRERSMETSRANRSGPSHDPG
jgi:hypothetical protein